MKISLLSTLLCLLFILPISAQKNAINFDGTNDYISTTIPAIAGNSTKTVEAWIRTTANCLPPSSGGTGQKVIVDMGTFINGQRFTLNLLWSNAVRLEVGGNGLSDTTAINDGQWHHVAAVYDPGLTTNMVKLYVDGVLKSQGNLTVAVNTGTSNSIVIGRRVDNVNYFDGDIDEVRIWSTARTAAEIAANYQKELCPPYSSLLKGYFRFNQGNPAASNTGLTTAYNEVATGNGTLYNMALSGNGSNWISGQNLPGSSASSMVINQCSPYTTPSGQLISSTGVYYDTFTNFIGCDSLVTYDANIGASYSSITASACTQYTSAGGQVYTSSGTYADTFTAANGCDSIISVDLTILQSTSANLIINQCGAYTSPSGKVLTSSGTYMDTITNAQGCDSVITIHLNLLAPTVYTNKVNHCGSSYTDPTGTSYNQSGTYRDTFTAANGCDSIVELQLLLEELDKTVNYSGAHTVVAVQSNVSYQWYDCSTDQIISGANSKSITNQSTTPKSYKVVLTGTVCVDTSDCYTVQPYNDALQELDQSLLKIYPNPVHTRLFLEATKPIQAYVIYSLMGERCRAEILASSLIQSIDLQDLVPGLYYIEVHTADGHYRKLLSKD